MKCQSLFSGKNKEKYCEFSHSLINFLHQETARLHKNAGLSESSLGVHVIRYVSDDAANI